jgi:hypothetical protein
MLGLMEKIISRIAVVIALLGKLISHSNLKLRAYGMKKITFAERALVYCAKCVFALRAPGIYAEVIANI